MSDSAIEKMLALAKQFEETARDLKKDGMYSCCANTYEFCAAEIRRSIKESLS